MDWFWKNSLCTLNGLFYHTCSTIFLRMSTFFSRLSSLICMSAWSLMMILMKTPITVRIINRITSTVYTRVPCLPWPCLVSNPHEDMNSRSPLDDGCSACDMIEMSLSLKAQDCYPFLQTHNVGISPPFSCFCLGAGPTQLSPDWAPSRPSAAHNMISSPDSISLHFGVSNPSYDNMTRRSCRQFLSGFKLNVVFRYVDLCRRTYDSSDWLADG